jgi:hypothetical protein
MEVRIGLIEGLKGFKGIKQLLERWFQTNGAEQKLRGQVYLVHGCCTPNLWPLWLDLVIGVRLNIDFQSTLKNFSLLCLKWEAVFEASQFHNRTCLLKDSLCC